MTESEEVTVNGKQFVLFKFPAVQGRSIVAGYPMAVLPKLSGLAFNDPMLSLMHFVSAKLDNGSLVALSTKELINRYTGDWETLMLLEKEALRYNCSFFQNGKVSDFLKGFAQMFPELISKISTTLSEPSSVPTKQP